MKKERTSVEKPESRWKSESISRKLSAKVEKEIAVEEMTRTTAEKLREAAERKIKE